MNILSAKYIKNVMDSTINSCICVTTDNETVLIPTGIDINHPDWIAILEWVEDGNTIEDAD